MKNVLYMAVTPDELELPIACAESVGELARIVGKSCASISTSIHKKYSGKSNGFKVIKVLLTQEEDE